MPPVASTQHTDTGQRTHTTSTHTCADQAVDSDVARLAQPIRPVLRLQVVRWVPAGVKHNLPQAVRDGWLQRARQACGVLGSSVTPPASRRAPLVLMHEARDAKANGPRSQPASPLCQQRSPAPCRPKLTTLLAAVRLSPRPPAMVDMRKRKMERRVLNSSHRPCVRACVVMWCGDTAARRHTRVCETQSRQVLGHPRARPCGLSHVV